MHNSSKPITLRELNSRLCLDSNISHQIILSAKQVITADAFLLRETEWLV